MGSAIELLECNSVGGEVKAESYMTWNPSQEEEGTKAQEDGASCS